MPCSDDKHLPLAPLRADTGHASAALPLRPGASLAARLEPASHGAAVYRRVATTWPLRLAKRSR
jgi:hypothetical protein